MPFLEQGTTAEPRDGALLRLAELVTAIDAVAELLTPTHARAIWRELETIARSLKQVSSPKPAHGSGNVVRTKTTL